MEFGAQSSELEYQIFLGGSCSFTTWREDKAIPYLKKNQVKFFNPQIDKWFPDLIEIKKKAKESSKVLLWIITNETRGTSSLIEVAHILGCNRDSERLALFMNPLEKRPIMENEVLPIKETNIIKCGRNAILCFAYNRGITVFNNMSMILQTTKEMLSDDLEGFYATKKTKFLPYVGKKIPTKLNPTHFDIDENSKKVQSEERNTKSLTVSVELKEFNKNLKLIYNYIYLPHDERETNKFEEFFALADKVWQYDPEKNPWGGDVIFFNINEQNRCLCSLLWAAFFMGKIPEAMVIHLTPMPDEETFSERAMRDYRRARCFLRDLAEENNVSMCDDFQESFNFVWKKIIKYNMSAKIHILNGHEC